MAGFTVEFKENGAIARVISSNGAEIKSEPGNMHDVDKHLKGKPVRDITSVTILRANPTCIMQDGTLWCWD